MKVKGIIITLLLQVIELIFLSAARFLAVHRS